MPGELEPLEVDAALQQRADDRADHGGGEQRREDRRDAAEGAVEVALGAVVTSGVMITPRRPSTRSSSAEAAEFTTTGSTSAAPPIEIQAVMSREVESLPSRRTSSIRFGVAFSVRSAVVSLI